MLCLQIADPSGCVIDSNFVEYPENQAACSLRLETLVTLLGDKRGRRYGAELICRICRSRPRGTDAMRRLRASQRNKVLVPWCHRSIRTGGSICRSTELTKVQKKLARKGTNCGTMRRVASSVATRLARCDARQKWCATTSV